MSKSVTQALRTRSLPRTGRTDLFGVRLRPETIELAKRLALSQGRTIGDIVERSIAAYRYLSQDAFSQELAKAIESCDAAVIVFSENAVKSMNPAPKRSRRPSKGRKAN